MERAAWTDERLEDFRGYVEKRFDQVDNRFDQVDKRFDQVDGRLDRQGADIRDVRLEIAALRANMVRVGAAFAGSMMVGFLALVGAVLQVG